MITMERDKDRVLWCRNCMDVEDVKVDNILLHLFDYHGWEGTDILDAVSRSLKPEDDS